jgi:pimeloyl-ACP methyl ester carboxylesterase
MRKEERTEHSGQERSRRHCLATFIFLHGSFHAAWNWHKVLPLLEALGQRAIALDLPAHGRDPLSPRSATLARNVEAVVGALDGIEGPAVLVAHSRNGIVISQAAEQVPERIEGLVYLAAYLVPSQRSMMDYALLDTESLVVQNIEPAFSMKQAAALAWLTRSAAARWLLATLLPSHRQTHALRPQIFREALYHDCPNEITELANTLLEPEPNWAGFTPLRLSQRNYGSVPKVYIECTEDRAVTLPLQRRMLQDSPCDRVFSLATGHSPFFSQPRLLVDTLLRCTSVFADVRAQRSGRARETNGLRAVQESG